MDTVRNSESFDDRIKRDAERALIQARTDLVAVVARMEKLEGDDPVSGDCYSAVSTSLQSILQRINAVIRIAQQVHMRDVTGIRPELN